MRGAERGWCADGGTGRALGLATLAALAAIILAIAGCRGLRVKEGIYANLTEARAAGAIANGWVPDGLPASAGDLREGHMPDGSHWGVFTFAPSDGPIVRALLRSEITSDTPACHPPGRLEWWPELLHSPIDLARVRATAFRLYLGADGTTYSVNWNDGRAYYWRETQ